MHWCTRTEIREVSAKPQKIYDDIRHGHLLIHAHAQELAGSVIPCTRYSESWDAVLRSGVLALGRGWEVKSEQGSRIGP